MRHEVRNMEVKKSVANGASIRVEDFREGAVHIGTTDGVAPVGVTVKIQGKASLGSFSISEWQDIATIANAAIVAGSRTPIPSDYTMLRIATTGYTSGNVVAGFSGKNSRTD